jgi:hypothetical protein
VPAPELIREELARAGATPDEATRLAALLERAAEPARFEVSRAEVEEVLERVRPARRSFHLPRVAFGGIAVAVAALLAIVLFFPRQQESVQARALDALGGPESVLHLRLEVFSAVPGVQGTTHRDVWFDASRKRVRWTQYADDGSTISETLVEPGRFERVLPRSGLRIVGTSCRAVAAGCAELVDPVTRYRDALERTDADFLPVSFEGRRAYRLILPLQGRIDQVVFVDKQTLLPRSIRWREHVRGGVFVAATIELTDAELLDRDDVRDVFTLPAGGRVLRVDLAGPRRGDRKLTVDQARARHPYWLGPRGLTSIRERRYTNGSVLTLRYGTTEVWTFGRVLPRELLVPRLSETKTLVVDGRPATLFSDAFRLTVVIDGSPSVAVIAPQATKEDVVRLARDLRRLR